MICPACSEDVDPVGVDIAPPLAICPACERSIVLDADGPRIAKAIDTATVSDDQLLALKKLRTDTRAARAAYYAARH